MDDDDDSIADQIINGECCALCMSYFEEEVGYPCACEECWEEGCGYQKSTEDVIN